MTTLKVSVSNKNDANILIHLLKKMSFVQEIEEIQDTGEQNNQIEKLQSILKENHDLDPFSEIDDPAEWENQIREEWK